jgi:hypothetical protein
MPKDAAYAWLAVGALDLPAHEADVLAGGTGALEQDLGGARRACGSVLGLDAVMAAPGAQVLAQELTGLGIEDPHEEAVPLRADLAADPAGGFTVGEGFHLNAAVEVHVRSPKR